MKLVNNEDKTGSILTEKHSKIARVDGRPKTYEVVLIINKKLMFKMR